MKLLKSITAQRKAERRAQLYRDLIRREAKVGGQLFGPVEAGRRREFFCLDRHTWVWHEEWTDTKTGQRKVVTTRYDVRPNGIIKAQDNQGHRYIELPEARNLYRAMQLYNQQVDADMYSLAV